MVFGTFNPKNPFNIPKPEQIQQSPVLNQSPAPPTMDSPEVFRDRETGLPSGITTKAGKTFLGLSPEDVEKIMAGERRKELPVGAEEVGTARLAQRQQLSKQEIAQQQISELSAIGEEDFTQLRMSQDGSFLTRLQEGWEEATPLQKGSVIVGGAALAAAGVALAGAALAGTGVAAVGKVATAGTVAKAGGALSALKSFKVLGYAGAAYGLITEKRARDLEKQMNDLRSISKELTRAVNRGLDPNEVRDQLIEMEQEMRDKGAELNVAKSRSISDRIVKSNAQTTIRRNVQSVVISRQIVEQYMIDGNLDRFNQALGVFGGDE